MDEQTARNFILDQGMALQEQRNPNAFLVLLQQGKSPVPGQMTSLLLALKILYQSLQATSTIDRPLAYSLYRLARDSRHHFEQGRRNGVSWSPLLIADLDRLDRLVGSILSGVWQD